MFINVVEFPAIEPGKEDEFEKWFAWTNEVFGKFPGFIRRRLLKPIRGADRYAAIVEHESEATFMTMHNSGERQTAWERVHPLFADASPTPRFYEVIVSSERETPGIAP